MHEPRQATGWLSSDVRQEIQYNMNQEQANDIVQQYGKALRRPITEGEIARCASWLPCPQAEVIKAFKLTLANYIENKALTQDLGRNIISAASFLVQFVPDDRARRINSLHKSIRESGLKPEGEEGRMYMEFTQGAFDRSIRDELDDFIDSVMTLDCNEPLYRQRLYTIIGIEHVPERRRSFWGLFS